MEKPTGFILTALAKIQSELKSPKNQENKFGNYKYRSCEDILEGVKPLLKATGTVLVIGDEVVLIGDRYYVKATASLRNDTQEVFTTAYAREDIAQKGMLTAQITGAASSYARKYALNGLLAIDDTKDADTADNSVETVKKEMGGHVVDDRDKVVGKTDVQKHNDLYKLLIEINNGIDLQSDLIRILYDITCFTGKDGKEISGVKSMKDLRGKRLDVTLGKAKQIIKDNKLPQEAK